MKKKFLGLFLSCILLSGLLGGMTAGAVMQGGTDVTSTYNKPLDYLSAENFTNGYPNLYEGAPEIGRAHV